MTTDLEKRFFDTFGIEPKYKTCIFTYCKNKKEYDCGNCNLREWHYPEITDRILLELICIYCAEMNCWTNYTITVEKLREEILKDFIIDAECFSKQQVQALFKEG